MMDNICKAANLQGGGTGIIYSIKCEKVLFTKDFDFGEANVLLEETVPYKRNLIGIFCIVQKDKAEQIAIAAIRAGSHGPTVVYGQGRGISERLGLMRIAISPEKELIRVIVDHYDVEAIFEAMVQEGKLNTPGMGFIYTMPVEKGLVNIASIATGKNQLAHQYQIIKAIDELKGGSSWRTQRAGINKKQRAHLKNLCRLTCVTARGQGDSLIQVAIDAGAPGASVSYGIEGETERTTSPAIWLNREVEVIEMTVSPQRVDEIIFAMLAATEEKENSNNYFYVQQVSKALTYLE
jgi:nitrogen regulatory protein PII